MAKKEDFVKLTQKDPSLGEYRTEKRSPFFWAILLIVALITVVILFFIVNAGSSLNKKVNNDISKEENTNQNKTPEDSSSKTSSLNQNKIEDSVKKDVLTDKISAEIDAKIKTVQNLINSGNMIEGRKLLYELYGKRDFNLVEKNEIENLIGNVNIEIFNSDIPCPEKKLYTIQKGDTLVKIADDFNTTVEAIQRANRMDPGSHLIFPGKTLCIYQGQWKIVVSKKDFSLRLYDGEKLFKRYIVGIGKQGRTPSGEFIITAKQKDPVWYIEGKAIPFGASENILGTRWLALTPAGTTDKNLKGYGIHGTWEPNSVGSATSNGCIRMKSEDVEELFSIIPLKTTVIIED